jgi:FdhD protein
MVDRVTGLASEQVLETVIVEETLEIQLGYGSAESRQTKSISVTMRTPGYDVELAAGFLMTEGVIRDVNDIEDIVYLGGTPSKINEEFSLDQPLVREARGNIVRVELAPHVEVSIANLQRNFYTTSSCGICGKASLLALRTVCPARLKNEFSIEAEIIYELPNTLRKAQGLFDQTGGLHGAGLFDASGNLLAMREDVGRHNAVDKLIGAQYLADQTPLRNRLLMLSGRASFELLQKALMGGFAMVASVGAPSSLAVAVAREFNIILAGFVRNDHFNIYQGAEHVTGCASLRKDLSNEVTN